MTPLKRIVLTTAAVGLCGATLAPPVHAAPASDVPWGSCEGYSDPRLVEFELECAKIEVPLDHSRPGGKKIKIALSRKKATAPAAERQGALFVNPGGPGGSGLIWAYGLYARLPEKVRATYDIIGFDPRGVGDSEPAMSCDPDTFKPVMPDPVPESRADQVPWHKRAISYAAQCARKYPRLINNIKTTDVARDIDLVRLALGENQINYFGYSYGTWLGATYATLFPQKVRRLTLDSMVRPSGAFYGSNMDQNYAFDLNAKKFFDWVARHDGTYKLGDDPAEVEKAYYQMREAFGQKPAGDLVGPFELENTFLVGGYNNAFWPDLAEAWSEHAVNGNSEPLIEAFKNYGETTEDNGYAVYTAVECTDAKWPRNWRKWQRDADRAHAKAPFMTWNNTWFNAPCRYWAAKAGKKTRITGENLPGVLLIQATNDAATPYRGGAEMHRLLPSSRLIVEKDGMNHGVFGGNPCVDEQVAAYFESGDLPPGKRGPDAFCDAMPEPEPETATATTMTAPEDPFVVRPR